MAFGRDPRTLYVGLGDFVAAVPTLTGGMIKTSDGGKTWSPFVSLAGANLVAEVAVDRSGAADVVLVGTDNGLWRSTDGGQTYTRVGPFTAGTSFLNVVWSVVPTMSSARA